MTLLNESLCTISISLGIFSLKLEKQERTSDWKICASVAAVAAVLIDDDEEKDKKVSQLVLGHYSRLHFRNSDKHVQ